MNTYNGQVRHRRLYAFYNSKVLNVLIIAIEVILPQIVYVRPVEVPVVLSAVLLAMFTAYAAWLWLCKPRAIVINRRLSNNTIWFTLYIVACLNARLENPWWYASAAMGAAVLLFVNMIKPRDELFNIAD